jgi:hypothetical protein
MSLKRWNARRDTTSAAILKALRDVGADYEQLDTFDVLVWYRGQLTMLDCKSKGGKATKAQQRLIDRGWPLRFVSTPAEALRSIGVEIR